LRSEKKGGIKELRNKKTAGSDDVPGDVLKLLGEDGHRIMTQMINRIFENRE
jgi:hypothetical protein